MLAKMTSLTYRLDEVASKMTLMTQTTVIPSKFQFSGHETFPLRQLWLRKAYTSVAAARRESGDARHIFADDAAIRRFGVGKNMVSAIRHWALACDVLTERAGGAIEPGVIGDFLFGKDGVDPYLERPATCWLVHWLLARRAATRSTTWYWLFNHVTSQTFDRDVLVRSLEDVVKQKDIRVSSVTLKRDVEVCLRCYTPRPAGHEADDAAEPLLADLGLVSEGPPGMFHFRRGSQQTLPDGIFAFALLEYWKGWEDLTGSKQMTLSFESIAHDYGSPGRVFKLDENAVAERLIALERITRNTIQWTDSAGVRQISRRERALTEDYRMSMLRGAYER
jgi:hypothetical protein